MAKLALLGSVITAALLLVSEAPAAAPDAPLIVTPPPPPSPVQVEAKQGGEEEEEKIPRPLLALGAGALITTASFTTGVIVVTRYSDSSIRNPALLGALSGMTLAPIVAHAIVGETKRGLLFGLIPLTAELGIGGLMLYRPNFLTLPEHVAVQYTFIALLAGAIFGSALGTLDAVRVGERRSSSQRVSVRTWPMFGDRMAGAMIGGSL